jgi:hypothetical protein
VWKNTSVTKDVYRQLLLEKVIPSIIEKWPRTQWNNNAVIIRIQHDGATSHIDEDDEEFWMGLVELGVFKQPANSPDVNINDLGYFRALQSLYHQYCPNDEAGIIQFDLCVIMYYWLFPTMGTLWNVTGCPYYGEQTVLRVCTYICTTARELGSTCMDQ